MGKVELRIEVDEVMVEQMRAANIHAAVLFELALKAALGPAAAEERARQWETDNREAIDSHNRFVEENPAFLRSLRTW